MTDPKRPRGDAAAPPDRQCSPNRAVGDFVVAGAPVAAAGHCGCNGARRPRPRCERPSRAVGCGVAEVRAAPFAPQPQHRLGSLPAQALGTPAWTPDRAVAGIGARRQAAGAIEQRLLEIEPPAMARRPPSWVRWGCRVPAADAAGCALWAKSIFSGPSRAGTRWGPRPRCHR